MPEYILDLEEFDLESESEQEHGLRSEEHVEGDNDDEGDDKGGDEEGDVDDSDGDGDVSSDNNDPDNDDGEEKNF